jgi:MFS family permease
MQPLWAQLADIFGRRYPTLAAVSLFVLGSGISGGAISMHMLIGGRVVQGIGGGGIQVLVNLIVCDLVPLRQRGKYFALIYGATTVANGLGPFISGVIVTNASWRWVFYLNLPIGGLALCLLFIFLHVKAEKQGAMERLKRIDFLGHFVFVCSVTSILIALTYAGSVHPWSSWRTILPLTLGFLGLGAYLVYEGLGIPVQPSMPLRIFANRTSGAVFGLGFLHSLLTVWVIYFLPVYFQSVKGSSPQRAGIQLLPTILILMPFAAVSGKLLERFGFYRLLHGIGFAGMTAGFGVFTLLTASSSTAQWVLVQFLQAAGGGLVVSTMLPAVQAPLPEADTAVVTGAFSFIRSFGISFAVTVPGTLFNNRFGQLAYRIQDAAVRAELSGGKAYEHATSAFVGSLHGQTKTEVISVYSDSLKFVWQVAIGISGFAFLLVFLEKHHELRKTLDTKFGVEEKDKEEEL